MPVKSAYTAIMCALNLLPVLLSGRRKPRWDDHLRQRSLLRARPPTPRAGTLPLVKTARLLSGFPRSLGADLEAVAIVACREDVAAVSEAIETQGARSSIFGLFRNKECTFHGSEHCRHMTTFSAENLKPRPSAMRSALIGYFGLLGLMATMRKSSSFDRNVRP